MPVNKILEYQRIDMNIYKKEKELAQSDEMKRLKLYKEDIKVKNDTLNKLLKELSFCYKQLEELENKFNETEKICASFDIDFDKFSDLKEFDKFESEMVKYEENLITINRTVNKIVKRINEIDNENKKLNDLIDKRIREFNKTKEAATIKQKELLKEAVPYAKQLKALEGEINKKYLKKYRELRDKKKMPAFVMYSDGNCLGCGMDISVEVDKLITKIGDCAECPNCGRIVYKIK